MLREAARSLIEFYATRLPYHPGKWRVTEGLHALAGTEAMDQGREFLVERAGVRWKLRTECILQRKLYYHGLFDRHDVRELLGRLPQGGVFLDIGSYFGYYAMLAGRRGAQVYAFEPFPQNYELLAAHAALNGFKQVQIFPLALSDAAGRMRFAGPEADNGGRGHLATDSDPGAGVEVETATLDGFVQAHGIARIDALKLDVEGAECRVLAGGRESITRFKPAMLIELNPPCLERLGSSGAELLRMVGEFGYAPWVAGPRGLRPFEGLAAGENYTNIICLPRA